MLPYCYVWGGLNYKPGGFQRSPHHTLKHLQLINVLSKKANKQNLDALTVAVITWFVLLLLFIPIFVLGLANKNSTGCVPNPGSLTFQITERTKLRSGCDIKWMMSFPRSSHDLRHLLRGYRHRSGHSIPVQQLTCHPSVAWVKTAIPPLLMKSAIRACRMRTWKSELSLSSKIINIFWKTSTNFSKASLEWQDFKTLIWTSIFTRDFQSMKHLWFASMF